MEREHQRPQLSPPVGLDSPGSPSRAALIPLAVIFYSPLIFMAGTGNMVLNPHLHKAAGSCFPFCACNLSSSLATHKLIARAICLLVQADVARAISKSDLLGLSKPLAKSNCLPHAGTIGTSEVSTKWHWLKVSPPSRRSTGFSPNEQIQKDKTPVDHSHSKNEKWS